LISLGGTFRGNLEHLSRCIRMLAWIELEGGEGWGERGLPPTPAKKLT